MKRLLFFIILFACASIVRAEVPPYGVAVVAAPVLNIPDFRGVFGGTFGNALKTDRCRQVRELEYIALPGTVFTILGKQRSGAADIYQVETDEYAAPPNVRLYVDGRFLALKDSAPEPRRRSLPSRDEITAALRASVGSPYVWGGNSAAGVPELAAWYYGGIREGDSALFTLAGLDCSGLLYQATGGWTPRNTSQLLAFGQGMAIAGRQSGEIAAMLHPLDLIVWNGHVIIVLDRQTAIESRLKCGKPGSGGVMLSPLQQRIAEIMRMRRPADSWPGNKKMQNLFVVRRWYPGL